MKTISRLYKDYDIGARVVAELEQAGIPHDDISIVANNESGWFDRDGTTSRVDRDHDGRDDRAEGAAAGAGIGASLGGVAGLLAGLGLLAIPGIGPVVAAGWLASTAAMAAAGGTAGGLIGALTQSGHDENEARTYAEGVQRGGTLVTVRVDDSRAATAEAIMQRYDDRTGASTTGTAYREGTTGTEYREDGSGDRIVAVFENTERAATAREALIGDGVDNARMELIDRRSDFDDLAALKRHALPDEDTNLYAESLGRGHAILVIRAASREHDRIMQVLSRFNPIDIEEDGHAVTREHLATGAAAIGTTSAASANLGTTTARTDYAATGRVDGGATARTGMSREREEVIPVVKEELEVGKRATERRYRVKSYVVERPIEKTVTVRDERVEIEHRPISRTGDLSMPQERAIEVVERHEEPFAEKRVTGAEEIVVRKEVVERPETVHGTVRETKVEVDDGRGTATTPTNPSTTPPRR
jgi:hypothetical protein